MDRLKDRLANQRPLTQRADVAASNGIVGDSGDGGMVVGDEPFIWARCRATSSVRRDAETSLKSVSNAWDVCATKVVTTAEKRPACSPCQINRAR